MTNLASSDAAVSARPDTPAGRAGFGRAVLSEWTKLRTTRATVWIPVVMTLLIPAFAVFVGATHSLQPDDTILGGSLTGAITGQLAAGILGVLTISTEYSTGTIRTTFAASPRRASVLAAKATVVTAVVFVASLPACSVAYLIGAAMLDGEGYAQGEPMPALLGVALSCSMVGVLGLAVGTTLRHSAGAITAILGLMLIPALFGPLFGDWQRWIGGASPTAALQKLSQTSDAVPEAVGTLGAWPSLLLVCAYTAIALTASARLLQTRDA
jgi:ABC-2 type transport system permease protein